MIESDDNFDPSEKALETYDQMGPFQFKSSANANGNILNILIAQYDNDSFYRGQWNKLSNQREGQGILIWPDGEIYEGHWMNDERNGSGRFIEADGGFYEGNWVDNKKEGHGVYKFLDGSQYEGEY